jgi:tRNA(Ile)-lysidine synthase
MKRKVIATIQKYKMLEPGQTIVVAVSGGVDSMVLLHVLSEIKNEFDLTLVIAHMDHAKRIDSVLDARLVREAAKKYGFAYEEATLPDQVKHGNFHAYARCLRYSFLRQVATRYTACAVATAHHANDHLETVIDRIMRADAPASLIGIQPNGQVDGVDVIRPLIELTKEELYNYAQVNAVTWRADSSNATDCYMRNRIRKHLVPKLVDERSDVLVHVRNLSNALADDEAYFATQIDALMIDVTNRSDGYEMGLSWLRRVHHSLKRRLILRMIPNISKGALLDLIDFIDQDNASALLDIGDHMVAKKSYDAFYLTTKQRSQVDFYEMNLVINEPVDLPTGENVSLFQGRSEKFKIFTKNEAQVTYLCYNKIRLPLKVRNRRPGDRIQLVNQKGHAKVKQIMIDKKVPIEQRDIWPIVVDSNDLILWIPGLKKSPFCLEHGSSKDFLIIFQ